jgi:hypothetical protein
MKLDLLELLGLDKEELTNLTTTTFIQCLLNGQMILYSIIYEMTHRIKELEGMKKEMKDLPESLTASIRNQIMNEFHKEIEEETQEDHNDVTDKFTDKFVRKYEETIDGVLNIYKNSMLSVIKNIDDGHENKDQTQKP